MDYSLGHSFIDKIKRLNGTWGINELKNNISKPFEFVYSNDGSSVELVWNREDFTEEEAQAIEIGFAMERGGLAFRG